MRRGRAGARRGNLEREVAPVRIGLLSDPELVNSNYRAYQPLMAVKRCGHEIVLNRDNTALATDALLRCDAVLVHRIATAGLRELVHRLHAAGVGVVWDNDDDVLALPRWNPHYRRLGAGGRREMAAGVSEVVRIADVVTTPSAALAQQYRELGAGDVRVIENHLPPEFQGVRQAPHDGVVIACLAGLEHQVDYQRLGLHDAFARLLDAHADVRLLCIGVGPGFATDRCEHLPLVRFLELVPTLARADIGVAPLIDVAWNRARSNVKLKEYAAAGLAWLASPVGPYAGMGERQGGRLVPDDGWHDALARLVINARERRKLAKRAGKWARGEGIDQHASRWEAALREAAARSTHTPQREAAGGAAPRMASPQAG
jgi:glycosyltransferase involved in cell wall biosynthesis